MRRNVKLLLVSLMVGALMIMATVPAFAVPPIAGGTPADDTPAGEDGSTPAGLNPAHDASCDGQTDALDNVEAGDPQGAPADLLLIGFGIILDGECGP